MDSSLARGLKNQLFRNLTNHVDEVISRYFQYLKRARLDKRPSDWGKFCDDTEKLLGPLLLAQHKGGTKRKPYLCIYTLENESRDFNSWTEQCISTSQLFISANPPAFEVAPLGFNISDHAIKRIYERSLNDSAPLSDSFQHIQVLSELSLATYYIPYWGFRMLQSEKESERIFLPSPNGVLLGEINRRTFIRAEIRTFLSLSQLNKDEQRMRTDMIELAKKFESIHPFLFLPSAIERIEWRQIDLSRESDNYQLLTNSITTSLELITRDLNANV